MPDIQNIKKIDLTETQDKPNSNSAGFFNNTPEQKKIKLNFPKPNKWFLIALLIPLALLTTLVASSLYVYSGAKNVIASVHQLQTAYEERNLDKLKTGFAKTKKELQSLDTRVNILVWTRPLPLIGNYSSDLKHATKGSLAAIEAGEIILETTAPYADLLGFNGGTQATDGAKTAEDRINFIVETVEQVVPQIDTISEKTAIMAKEFGQIDPDRYPKTFRGNQPRSKIKKSIETTQELHQMIADGKPVLKQLPYLLGVGKERTYLVLWQNDKEIRPTGGFITAYSIMKIKNGKIERAVSNDIYTLDGKFKSKIPAPEPIEKYLPLVPYWNLRDMNLSPDFKVSMDTFSQNYDTIRGIDNYDGIIAVDTHPLVGLLSVMGQLGVPEFGNFSSDNDPRCNCPVVIYELESYADVVGPIVWDDISGKIVYKPPHADNRKAILGPLMNTLVANAMGQPKEKLPDLFNVVWSALTQKHALFYFKDEEVQSAMESFNLAGRLKNYDGDYLHINDTNFAGAKSNLYVEEEANLIVEQTKEGTTNTLTIKYKNPQKHDGWLNGPYRDWFRVYVPKGSTLVDSSGSEVPMTTTDDLGKTVFEGFFTLRPLGITEIKIQYKTPTKNKNGYKLLIQKQPGTAGHQYTIKVGKKQEEFKLTSDKELKL